MLTRIKTTHLVAGLFLVVGLSFALVSLIPSHSVGAAGPAKLLLTPASGSYKVGDTFSVKIYEDSGSSTVIAAEADLTYDKNVLRLNGVDTQGTAFSNIGPSTTGGGLIKIGLSTLNAVSGKQYFATLSFTALSSSSATKLSFINDGTNGAGIADATNGLPVWDGNTNGATFSLTAPPTAPVTTPTTTPAATPPKTTTTPTASTPKKTTTPVVATATPSKASPTTVAPAPTPTTPAENSAEVAADIPVTQTVNDNERFVAIKVVDSNNKLVEGATVTIDGQTVKTDAKGIASFVGVIKGAHTVKVSYFGKTTTQKIAITPSSAKDNTAVQSFGVKLDHASTQTQIMPVIYAGLVAVVIITIWLMLTPSRRLHVHVNSATATEGIFVGGKTPPTAQGPAASPSQIIHPTTVAPTPPDPAHDPTNEPKI